MERERGGPPSQPHSSPERRRPGRPRKETLERAELRREYEEKQSNQPLPVDDLDHGHANVPIHFFARGKVIKRLQTCGKKDCACRKGGKFLHGPYYYLVITNPIHNRRPDEPKQKWFYLTEDEAERLKARVRNFNLLAHNLYADIMDQMRAGSD